jgi:hypothetical protein
MAFASSVTNKVVVGNRKMTYGTFTNASTDNGGTIATGLETVDFFDCCISSHIGSLMLKVTKNYDIDGAAAPGSVAIQTAYDADGDWFAIGL